MSGGKMNQGGGETMKSRLVLLMTVLVLSLSASCALTQKDGGEHAAPPVITENNPTESAPAVTPPEAEQPHVSDEPAKPSPVNSQPPPQETALLFPEPDDADFVLLNDYVPSIDVELKYAAADNFIGQVIYDFDDAYLRYGTVKKLMAVQEALTGRGFGLKIWDAFRPVQAQFELWEACPDPRYVADPNKGYSSHSKGNTVDVTLVDAGGSEVMMPTDFDDFTALADRDYSDVDPDAAANALLLEEIMLDCGFSAYSKEWWHFSDTTAYPVDESFIP
jgi:D-alanyl-D-alanine dipeptidase